MTPLKLMSLNGQDMIELVPRRPGLIPGELALTRSALLAELIGAVDPDILGLVEAPTRQEQTQEFVDDHLAGKYVVFQGELRGSLGIALLVRRELGIDVVPKSKRDGIVDFALGLFDADNDGIKEHYTWANRVPFECRLTGGVLSAPVTFIVIHAKSKGAFIPGDLYAYERVSRANRMKLRAQAASVRKRLDRLVDAGERVVVMGDMNDGPEFDYYAAVLGGAFLEPVMGSVWEPERIFGNPHASLGKTERWTIDYADRVLNPLESSKYGAPAELRSWIDHILLSPNLKDAVVADSAGIARHTERLFADLGPLSPTDHHPPYVSVNL